MSEDRWKIKTLASETSKGVIWCCRVPPKGSPQAIPFNPSGFIQLLQGAPKGIAAGNPPYKSIPAIEAEI